MPINNAGGTDTRHGDTTLVDETKETRAARTESFSTATDQLIGNFDAALTKFETDVREGKANVRVARKTNSGGGGGGAIDLIGLAMAGGLLLARRRGPSRDKLCSAWKPSSTDNTNK